MASDNGRNPTVREGVKGEDINPLPDGTLPDGRVSAVCIKAFSLIFLCIFLLHITLLSLPYFGDEVGYYIPAARDLLLAGDPVPHSVLSNAHPPLVPLYLALCWKLFWYSPTVTRTAMLFTAAFALLGVYVLSKQVASRQVAIATTICTALYPVFFAQSTLAHLDIAVTALTIWGLVFYLPLKAEENEKKRRIISVIFFSAAVLTKETAVLAPLALFTWELCCTWMSRRRAGLASRLCPGVKRSAVESLILLVPLGVLLIWFAYHYWRVGYVFGNPEFFRYNVWTTLHPLRILITLLGRLWQIIGHMNLIWLTLVGMLAMKRPPIVDDAVERKRIAVPVQVVFAVIIAVYVLALSAVGGAVLARYMLPIIPLVILIWVSTLYRRVRRWRLVVSIICLLFVLALFINPPYRFPREENLAYSDYVRVHKHAAEFISAHYGRARVLTTWPATDELTKPYLGYTDNGSAVVPVNSFTAEGLNAATAREDFDVVYLFNINNEPLFNLPAQVPLWQSAQKRFFGYREELTPEEAARLFGGSIIYRESRGTQWAALIEVRKIAAK